MVYVITHPSQPDITVKTYIEMLTCLYNIPVRKAYRYCKAADGILKPQTEYSLIGDYPVHRPVTVFECPTAYTSYPEHTNMCACGWLHMQGSVCMSMACDYPDSYNCPSCGVDSVEGKCPHMTPYWSD